MSQFRYERRFSTTAAFALAAVGPCTATSQQAPPPQAAMGPAVVQPTAPPPIPLPRLITLTIRGTDPSLRYEVFRNDESTTGEQEERPWAVCAEACWLRLPEGSYRLQVSGPPGSNVQTSDTTVDLSRDAQLMVDPPSRSARTTGLMVGILGIALIPAGAAVAFLGVMDNTDWRGGNGDPKIYAGLGTAAVGVALATAGWIVFGKNGKPRIEVTPSTPTEQTGLRLGPARLAGGWGLSGSIAF